MQSACISSPERQQAMACSFSTCRCSTSTGGANATPASVPLARRASAPTLRMLPFSILFIYQSYALAEKAQIALRGPGRLYRCCAGGLLVNREFLAAVKRRPQALSALQELRPIVKQPCRFKCLQQCRIRGPPGRSVLCFAAVRAEAARDQQAADQPRPPVLQHSAARPGLLVLLHSRSCGILLCPRLP